MNTAPAWLRYLGALSLLGVSLAVRLALTGVLPEQGFPFLTFFPAVLLATYFAGLGPGVFTAVLSILAAWYFFIEPVRQLFPLDRADAVALVVFSVVLFVDCIVVYVMNSALARVRHTEALLRASEQRLRGVLDRLHVHVALLDLDGTVREVNEAPLRPARRRRSQVLGRAFWDTAWWQDNPAAQQAVREAVLKAARGETVRYDTEVQLAPGEHVTVDFQLAPLREPDGRIGALVACGTDVTERVKAWDALARSRQQAVAAAEEA